MAESDVRIENGDRIPGQDANEIFYIDPSSQNHVEYFDHLRAFNSKVQRDLSLDMGKEFTGLSEKLTFATTGSDARLEKGPVSPIEIVLIARDKNEYYAELASSLNDYLIARKSCFHLDGLEIKFYGNEPMVNSILGRGSPTEVNLLSPGRILDAGMIFGDKKLYDDAKKEAVREIFSDNKNILNKIRDRARQHRKIAATGMQSYRGESLRHFDLETGIAHYDPEQHLQSFKQGPLRAVQNSILTGLCYLAQEAKGQEILPTLPANTIDKLHHLQVEGMTKLNVEQVRELADHYKYFLWLYHRSQQSYRTKKTTTIGFDANEARERVKATNDICSYGIVK